MKMMIKTKVSILNVNLFELCPKIKDIIPTPCMKHTNMIDSTNLNIILINGMSFIQNNLYA